MKKIILIITLCFIFLNNNTIAQTQFSGWYENNPNNGDIVVNTAITNFVSTKMLKIDTYFEPNTGIYYFELSFLDDYLNPVGQTIRYDYPTCGRMMINDVKYDIVNDCYVACGYIYNNAQGALLMCFDNSGMIIWQTSGYNYTAQYGANEYRRVELCRLRDDIDDVMVYAVCGYGYNGAFEYGIIGFYDQSGSLLSMYRSTMGGVFRTLYTDIVFNPLNNHLVLTGTFIDETVYAGYLFHEYVVNTTSPYPVTPFTTIRYGYEVEANAIEFDQSSIPPYYYYYISGSNVTTGELFLSQTDLSNAGTNEIFYNTYNNNIIDIRVSDNCMNPGQKLGVTGYCIDQNGIKEGFLAEIDVNPLNNYLMLNFSKWSGNQAPNLLPFNDAYFQHIVYRDNMAVPPDYYSYILYGLPEYPHLPYSYIAEYYPDNNFGHCSDLPLGGVNNFPGYFTYEYDYVIADPIVDFIPDYSINYLSQILNIECDSPVFSTIKNNHRVSETSVKNEPIVKSDFGFLLLNTDYTNAKCFIYNTNGQLICSKEKGKSIIDTSQLPSGIYILQPFSYLKTIKFNIVK